MSAYEERVLSEVNQRCQWIFAEELSLPVTGEASSFGHACNLPGLYIRKIIRFCKSIPEFKCLSNEDQLKIIKPYFTEMLLVRFTFAFSEEHNAFRVIGAEAALHTIYFKVDLMREAKNLANLNLIFRQFVLEAQQAMDRDCTIRNLLQILLIFKPRDQTNCPEFLR